MAVPALQLAAALAAFVASGRLEAEYGFLPVVSFLLLIPVGIRAAKRAIEVWITTYVATTHRVGVRRVFLTRRERYVWVRKVNDVRLSQGLVQRLFRCGDLVVESSGEADRMVLRYVPRVLGVHAELTQSVHRGESRDFPQP